MKTISIKKFTAFLLLASTLLVSCKKDVIEDVKDEPLRSKIAQMLLVGFRGTTPEELEAEEMGARYYIQELGVGGVVLYTLDGPSGWTEPRNVVSPEQLQKLTRYLTRLSRQPLMIAVDQEGGSVARLDQKHGFPATPSAQYLGMQKIDSTSFYSEVVACMLAEKLINVNFAPCVDVNVNPESPAIGKLGRSFSSDTAVVTACAKAWIEEHRKYGIISALKHFPGHGSALADSHLGITDVTNTWQPYEFAPYRDLFASTEIDMVMTAHVFNRHFDADYPATLSKKIIDGILRKEMRFDGVVISDDINMKAIADHYSLEHAIELSINAGCDMLIISNNIENYDATLPLKTVDIIEKLVANGKIQSSRIDEAYNRIMRVKRRISLP